MGKINPIPEELLNFPKQSFDYFEFRTESLPCTCDAVPCMCGGWSSPGVRLVLHRRPEQKGYAVHKVTPSFTPSKPQQVWFDEVKPSGRTLVQGLLTGGISPHPLTPS